MGLGMSGIMMGIKSADLVTRLRNLADCDARAAEPLGKCMREAAIELERLRDIEVIYDQIKRIASIQNYDPEMNYLEYAAEFTDDLWKAGIFDILHPQKPLNT